MGIEAAAHELRWMVLPPGLKRRAQLRTKVENGNHSSQSAVSGDVIKSLIRDKNLFKFG